MSQPSPVMPDMVEPADISAPLERLHAGEPFVQLQIDDIVTRAATLDALLTRLADTDTRLVWIGNPLRSPLTTERLFLQAAGAEADLRVERSPEELVAFLRSACDGAARSLLIVQQPETLDPEARDTLARIGPLLSGTTPVIQFLFCGTAAFRPIASTTALPALVQQTPFAPTLHHLYDSEVELEPRATTREKLPLFLLLIIAIAGTLFTASTADKPVQIAPVSPAEAVISPATAAPQAAQADIAPQPPVAPPPSAASPRVDVVSLRREFDAFLALQPSRASLSPEQRDILFREFIARAQQRQTPSSP